MSKRPRPAVLLGFAAMVVLIGINFVTVRMSNQELAPTWGAALRFTGAAVLLGLVTIMLRIPLPRGRALVGAALYGALFFGVFFGFAYWALVEMASATASVINATMPLAAFLIAVSIQQERFRWSAITGSLLVIIGVAILVGFETGVVASPAGIAAMFTATLGAAAGTVVVKGFPRSHPLATNTVAMAVAAVLLAAVSLIRGEVWSLPQSTGIWLVLGYLVVSSIALFPLVVWVIGEWTASASAYAVVIAPLVTVPVGAVLLSETVHWTFAIAAVVIAAGVYVGALWRGKNADSAPIVTG